MPTLGPLGTVVSFVDLHAKLEPEVGVFHTARKAVTTAWWHTDVTCSPPRPSARCGRG